MADIIVNIRLKINDRIQCVLRDTDEEVPTTYFSRVEDVRDDLVVIGWPTSGGIRVPVSEKEMLLLTFNTEQAVYIIEARVIDRTLIPIPLLTIRPEGSVRTIQRREFVRVAAMVDVRLASRQVISNPSGGVAPDLITAHTVNISGGGFAIHHNAPLQIGALFDVKLRFERNEEPMWLLAKVIRSDPVEAGGVERVLEIGFSWVDIAESVRRKIVGFVFRTQQSSLLRG